MDTKESLIAKLTSSINQETAAINQYGTDIENTRNPYVKQVLRHAFSDEHTHLDNLRRTLKFFEGRKNENFTWRDSAAMNINRLSMAMRSNKAKGFLWGITAAALLAALAPIAKKAVRPIAVKAVEGAFTLSENAKKLADGAKKGMEDITKEAVRFKDEQLSKIRAENDEITRGIIEELQSQRNEALKEAQELKTIVEKLERDIEEIRNNSKV